MTQVRDSRGAGHHLARILRVQAARRGPDLRLPLRRMLRQEDRRQGVQNAQRMYRASEETVAVTSHKVIPAAMQLPAELRYDHLWIVDRYREQAQNSAVKVSRTLRPGCSNGFDGLTGKARLSGVAASA